MSVQDDPLASVTAGQVRAFLVTAHHLDERSAGAAALTDLTGASGVQDSPPGSAAVALNARMDGLTPQALDQALTVDKTLVRTWAMRGTPYLVPTVDLAVFTTGVLPVDEDGRTTLVYGVRQSLDDFSLALDELVAATADAVPEVLAGQRLDIHELGRRVAEVIAPTLPDDDREAWEDEGPYASGVYARLASGHPGRTCSASLLVPWMRSPNVSTTPTSKASFGARAAPSEALPRMSEYRLRRR